MSYSDFSLSKVQTDFGIRVNTRRDLFAQVPPAADTATLQALLLEQARLAVAINTEKARSELLIAPVLADLWRRCDGEISVYSGVPLDVDAAAGLIGRCDFLIGRPPQLHYVTAPLMVIVEAKNEDIAGGLGQCAAAMVGAQKFNQKQANGITDIHGCVTDGGEWKFLRLAGSDLTIDLTEYAIHQVDRILGLLFFMVGVSPKSSAAA